MCDTEQTQRTTIPDASDEEKEMQRMLMEQFMPAYLSESGYEYRPAVKGYESDSYYQKLLNNYNEVLHRRKSPDSPDIGSTLNREQYLNKVQNQMDDIKAKYGNNPGTDAYFREKLPPLYEGKLRGLTEGSAEWEAVHEEYYKDLEVTEKANKEIADEFRNVTMKFLKGDFSITNQQKALIEESFRPQRQAVEAMYKELEGMNIKEMDRVMGGYASMVYEQGMDIETALAAAGEIIAARKDPVEEAFKKVVDINKQLLEKGIKDHSGEITRNIASRAASLGRSTTDPEYQREMSDDINEFISTGQLNLAAMEAQGMVEITREKFNKAEQAYRQLEERQYGTAREKGVAQLGLEEQEAAMKWQVGAGMPPQQTSMAGGYLQYQDALAQQRLANIGQAAQMPMGMMSNMQQLRAAQPTTTVTQSTSPWEVGLGLLSTGASLYGGFTTAGLYKAMTGYYQGKTGTQSAKNYWEE